ncbi:MAG: helix-turn-helix domain-containing protein [Saprospiraceae bacterium]|nr:helix-turn-helix domain-containing protein [Saprospiraceae bacterium]
MSIDKIIKSTIRSEFDEIQEVIKRILEEKEETSRYLTRKQVAQYLNIGLSTVDYWARIGKLHKIRIDGSVRFDKHQIDTDFINSKTNYNGKH